MIKISFIALFAAVIGMTMMSSCTKDKTHTAPTITLNPSATSTELDFTAGDSLEVSFSARVQAEGEIETFTINEEITNLQGGTTSSAYDASTTATFKGETDKTYDFSKIFTPADFASATQYKYTFSVTDKDGQSYSIAYTVTQHTGTQAGAIETYTAVLGAQSSSNGSYYDVSTNTVYTQSGADANQAAIDFVHYYGSANASTICAPSDPTVGGGSGNLTMCANWSTKNATLFGTVTGVDFSAISDDTEIVAHVSDATSTKANQLAVGDVVEFKTVDGKYGMFKVVSVDASSSESITIDVKVQQ